jgi:hypothetical protein
MKDKFMVQSIMCEDGATWSENIFKDAAPDRLMDSKIRCVFDASSNATAAGGGESGGANGPSGGTQYHAASDVKPVVEELATKKDVPGDYGSAVETITQLREENSRLLREKLELQEEAARLRRRANAAAPSSGGEQGSSGHKQQMLGENKPPGVNLTMEILAVAFLVTFFVALFIGKTIL